MPPLNIKVLTVSDRCFRNESVDTTGPSIVEFLKTKLDMHLESEIAVVPDEVLLIQKRITAWTAGPAPAHLIVTTGGTGFSQRDVTPEAVKPLLDKEAPGLVHAMMSFGLTKTPVAWLSRPVAGVRKNSVVITVPGSCKAAIECLTPLAENGLKHAIELASGDQRDPHPANASENQNSGPSASGMCTGGCGRSRGPEPTHFDPSTVDTRAAVADRSRSSEYPMVPMKDALEEIYNISYSFPKKTVLVDTVSSVGRILAEDVTSAFDHPPFRASIKDGYGVVASDGEGTYPVVGSLVAGSHPEKFALQPGQVCRVNTGGPVPAGANAVVQVEDTELVEKSDAGEEKLVKILKSSIKEGLDIRPIGCDLKEGGVAIKAGCVMQAPEVGLALSVGASKIKVIDAPTVAVCSTGDELVDKDTCDGNKPPSGKIFDSNSAMLLAACATEKVHVFHGGIAKDNMESTRSVIANALSRADVVITSGGVSMGEVDCVKKVLLEMGATIHFGRVNMKPGKPTTFAEVVHEGRRKLVFALPGNPVSAMVCFHLFVVPCLRAIGGHSVKLSSVWATLSSGVKLDPERPEYHRCFLKNNGDGTFAASSSGAQASHRLLSLAGVHGLMVLPAATADKKDIAANEKVEVILIAPLPSA